MTGTGILSPSGDLAHRDFAILAMNERCEKEEEMSEQTNQAHATKTLHHAKYCRALAKGASVVEWTLRTRRRASRNLPVFVLLLVLIGLLVGCSTSSTGRGYPPKPTPTPTRKIMGTIREFPLGPSGPGSPDSFPGFITTGPDGNLWFTESGRYGCCGAIGRITPTGTISRFPLDSNPFSSTSYSGYFGPFSITKGPDGNLWFTVVLGNAIGRITPTGTVSTFSLPNSEDRPVDITTGPDGNLWFTENDVTNDIGKIGRITPTGTFRMFPLPDPKNRAYDITTGPDGNLWFTEGASKIGRITPTGTITSFLLPTSNSPETIATGPDGALWFTVANNNKLWRITTTGMVSRFALPIAGDHPQAITTGPDGALWFTSSGGNGEGKVWRLA
jgi:streptogramin lyase